MSIKNKKLTNILFETNHSHVEQSVQRVVNKLFDIFTISLMSQISTNEILEKAIRKEHTRIKTIMNNLTEI